jgi:hypothetical protein
MTNEKQEELIEKLKNRFEKNRKTHEEISWVEVEKRLRAYPDKLEIINQMEATGGEPDVVGQQNSGEYIFMDCSAESPSGRRSLCYDQAALTARKANKPKDSAMSLAQKIGAEMLSEEDYRELQKLGIFDTKTSSWLKTPEATRKQGGAIFGDRRYGEVFVYHNGADSYYASRGFRSKVEV